MYTEEPTEMLALKIWWAMTWRSIPLSLIAAMAASVIMGVVVEISGGNHGAMQFPAMLAGFLIGVFIAVKVIKYLMTKGFGDYRLAVIKK